MKLRELIPTADQLSYVSGVEERLLKRERLKITSVIIAILGGVLQILIAAVQNFEITNIFAAIAGFWHFFVDLITLHWGNLQNYAPVYELAGIAVLGVAIGLYLLLQRTKFLIKESEEPFQYTFWINGFEKVEPDNEVAKKEFDDPIGLYLHLDLMERLSERIGRLSLLDSQGIDKKLRDRIRSHIYIHGQYTIRKTRDNTIVHVMPRIRIGASSQPYNLTYPIKFPIDAHTGSTPRNDDGEKSPINPGVYEDILERVYSSIATEIYKQIKDDLDEKITLFPTQYRRAVALYNEAKDFSESNTVDAYNHAIALYRKAIKYFDKSMKSVVYNAVYTFPLLWRVTKKFQQAQAETVIEYSRCLIYRYLLSTMSGRQVNTLYELPDNLGLAIYRMHFLINIMVDWKSRFNLNLKSTHFFELPEYLHDQQQLLATLHSLNIEPDSFSKIIRLKTSEETFKRQQSILFKACVTASLLCFYLGRDQKAEDYLIFAKAVGPVLVESDPVYLLISALLEPDSEASIMQLRKAIEIKPDFEIAHYLLSVYLDYRLRDQKHIYKDQARPVIDGFRKVTSINPGNISSLNLQGYLFWLMNDYENAVQKFGQGLETKAIIQSTFTGELNYGLARIAAEQGNILECYKYYTEASSSDPAVGAYSTVISNRTTTSYFNYMGPAILQRFDDFKVGFEKHIAKRGDEKKSSAEHQIQPDTSIFNVVYSFVLNDYGNAYLNYYHRFGNQEDLDQSIEAYIDAIEKNPSNKIVYSNLTNAYNWKFRDGDAAEEILEKIKREEEYYTFWPAGQAQFLQSLISDMPGYINRAEKEKTRLEKELEQIEQQDSQIDQLSAHSFKDAAGKTGQNGTSVSSHDIPAQRKVLTTEATLESKRTIAKSKINELQNMQNKIPEIFGNFISKTTVAPLFTGFSGDFGLKNITQLSKENIEKNKLNDNDLNALLIWAQILSQLRELEISEDEAQLKNAMRAAEKLAHFIEAYHFGHFQTSAILKKIDQERRGASAGNENPDTESVKDERRQALKNVESWIKQNELPFAALKWAESYYYDETPESPPMEQYEGFLKDAIKKNQNFSIGALHTLLAELYEKEHQQIRPATSKEIDGIEKLETAIKYYPGIPAYYDKLAVLLRNKPDLHRAEQLLSRAKKCRVFTALNQNNVMNIYNDLGNVYYERGAYKKAKQKYKLAIKARDDEVILYNNLGGAHRMLNELEDAEKAYLKALQINPEDAKTLNELGVVFYQQQKFREASEHFMRAADNDRATSIYLRNAGDAYLEDNNLQHAKETYLQAIDVEKNQLKDAEVKSENTVEIERSLALSYNKLGLLHYRALDFEEAFKNFKQAAEKNPAEPLYFGNMGDASAELNQWKKAEKYFKKALKIVDADNYKAFYLDRIATTYLYRGAEAQSIELIQKAISNYEEATRLDGTEPEYLVKLSQLYEKAALENNDAVLLTKATESMEKASSLAPENADYQNQLQLLRDYELNDS